ncbi:DUF1127 domain-containing protein [Roseomonas sp. HJA6]|uniref:DUF1127 domain-containing protein n=1 Tax=Roseomonas alba TaxID=2846776 RepID=A0ABS7AKE2_9PROT|nr:DUF1127 domain-containing protein [Neoroseomonas alba]MBW6401599.1 DUF1127 domain-containing protein [Neoroseomonas alba]
MDARNTKAEAALLLPGVTAASRHEENVRALLATAAAAREEAFSNAVLSGIQAAIRGLGAAVRGIASLPARLETYNALRRLSDRELRDIGMTRFDIGNVFEPGFKARAANDADEKPAPRAA